MPSPQRRHPPTASPGSPRCSARPAQPTRTSQKHFSWHERCSAPAVPSGLANPASREVLLMRLALYVALTALPLAAAEPLSSEQRIARAQAYASAVAANDYESARRLLGPSPRVWYEKREGEGEPL